MTLQNLSLFLFAYFLCATVLCIGSLARTRESGITRVLILLVSLAGLGGSVAIGATLHPGENFLFTVAHRLVDFSRTDVLSVALGVSCALPLSLGWSTSARRSVRILSGLFALAGIAGTLVFGGLFSTKEVLSPYLTHPDTEFGDALVTGLTQGDYVSEDFIETNIIPVRIAISPGGQIFVSGHRGIAAQEGGVVRLDQDAGGRPRETLVARMLNRPYGLIAQDDRLLVSRSGQYTRWNHGKAEQISTGAVTLLKDLDGDGVMDYYHDIVTDLPGAKGPDYLHQNNALAINTRGDLYITTATHTDAYPAADPLEGVILKASGKHFENVSTFATGLRNPFGLAFDSHGQLYATDNDVQTGVLGSNPGDKLLRVTEGAYFGHPYGDENDAGVSPHALRSTFALGGLTLATGDAFPEPLRDSLFVVIYGEGRIMRVTQQTVDGSKQTTLEPFATVPGAVDIAASPDGDFYVAVYPDKVVRLRQIRARR